MGGERSSILDEVSGRPRRRGHFDHDLKDVTERGTNDIEE